MSDRKSPRRHSQGADGVSVLHKFNMDGKVSDEKADMLNYA